MTEKILDRLSRYNLFNYLFPGIIFTFLLSMIININFLEVYNIDLVSSLFLYYFVGMIVSRIGSMFVEPILKKTKFVKFAKYGDYLSAIKQDGVIDILSLDNNVYRTFISTFLLLIFIYIANFFIEISKIEEKYIIGLILGFLFFLFLFAYKKQTSYIYMRISNVTKDIKKGKQ